jgi:hypothetical protein
MGGHFAEPRMGKKGGPALGRQLVKSHKPGTTGKRGQGVGEGYLHTAELQVNEVPLDTAELQVSRAQEWTQGRGRVQGMGTFTQQSLKVHKIENFFDSDFGICLISLLVKLKC